MKHISDETNTMGTLLVIRDSELRPSHTAKITHTSSWYIWFQKLGDIVTTLTGLVGKLCHIYLESGVHWRLILLLYIYALLTLLPPLSSPSLVVTVRVLLLPVMLCFESNYFCIVYCIFYSIFIYLFSLIFYDYLYLLCQACKLTIQQVVCLNVSDLVSIFPGLYPPRSPPRPPLKPPRSPPRPLKPPRSNPPLRSPPYPPDNNKQWWQFVNCWQKVSSLLHLTSRHHTADTSMTHRSNIFPCCIIISYELLFMEGVITKL